MGSSRLALPSMTVLPPGLSPAFGSFALYTFAFALGSTHGGKRCKRGDDQLKAAATPSMQDLCVDSL